MKLRDYLKSVRKSTDAFGAEIGVRGASVRRWTGGIAGPNWTHLERIIEATDGKVSWQDFLDGADTSAA